MEKKPPRGAAAGLCLLQPPSTIRCPALRRDVRVCALQAGRTAIVVCTGSDDCGASRPEDARVRHEKALMLGCPLLELFEHG